MTSEGSDPPRVRVFLAENHGPTPTHWATAVGGRQRRGVCANGFGKCGWRGRRYLPRLSLCSPHGHLLGQRPRGSRLQTPSDRSWSWGTRPRRLFCSASEVGASTWKMAEGTLSAEVSDDSLCGEPASKFALGPYQPEPSDFRTSQLLKLRSGQKLKHTTDTRKCHSGS